MKLHPQAREILRKSHTVRWTAVAFVLTGGEAVINVIGADIIPGPQWLRAVVVMCVIGGAFLARLRFKDDE